LLYFFLSLHLLLLYISSLIYFSLFLPSFFLSLHLLPAFLSSSCFLPISLSCFAYSISVFFLRF
jgi:hypothetical protein